MPKFANNEWSHMDNRGLFRVAIWPNKVVRWTSRVARGTNVVAKWTIKVAQGAAVHNVHFGYYDGPVVKMVLYMLQGHIM